jgi:hypothetical protein
MSQKIYQLPIEIRSDIFSAEWTCEDVVVCGWGRGDDDLLTQDRVVLRLAADPKITDTVSFSSLPRAVRRHLSEAYDAAFDHGLENKIFEPSFPSQVFKLFWRRESKRRSKSIDGWQLREKFLRLPHRRASALNFLNEVGSWTFDRTLDEADLWATQDLLKKALAKDTAPSWWFTRERRESPFLAPTKRYPFFEIITLDGLSLVKTTITLDLLNKVPFGACELCCAPFPFRRGKKFCSYSCAHLKNVRDSRLANK